MLPIGVGNGVGVKVIGGQVLPWADNQIGAYVSSILPGSVADQLHGELHEGLLLTRTIFTTYIEFIFLFL